MPAAAGGRSPRFDDVIQVTDFRNHRAYSGGLSKLSRRRSMEKNVGGVDRIVRLVAGLALLAWFLLGAGVAWWWGLIGAVLLGTGLFAWCPAYLPFGFKTCKRQ